MLETSYPTVSQTDVLAKTLKIQKSCGMETYAPMQFHAEDKNRKPIFFFAFLHQQVSLCSTLQKKKNKKQKKMNSVSMSTR